YQAETTSDIYMTKLKAEKGVNYKEFEYDKVMNCFDDLKNGRVDAIVCDSLVAVDYVADANAPYEIVWLGEADEFFGVCIKKGNDALTEKIDLALDKLFAEGKIQAISKEIFGSDIVSATRAN
ncbi:MAG TPA: amino acid ABC transporter substrate-binding protein, partial [Treponema sp.]|nr:amino acid ABC transporter substrate-binding protein [Treponema sp.]